MTEQERHERYLRMKPAIDKYRKSLAQFSVRLKHEKYDVYKDAAKKAGMPFRAFVLEAIEEKIGKM